MAINAPSITPTEIADAILAEWDIKDPRAIMIWGMPGIGKSEGVYQAAALKNAHIIDERLSQKIASDISGLPGLDHDTKKTIFFRPEFLPDDDGKPGILFLDELAGADEYTRIAAYGLILERRVGNYRLPEKWRIVAASNRPEDHSTSAQFGLALNNRLVHFIVETSFKSWSEWAVNANIHPAVLRFLETQPEMLVPNEDDLKNGQEVAPTPRGWTHVSDILNTHATGTTIPNIIGKMVCGTVGMATGTQFLAAAEHILKMPKISSLVKTKTEDELLKVLDPIVTDEDVLGAIAYGISGYLTVEDQSATETFGLVNRLMAIKSVSRIRDIGMLAGSLACEKAKRGAKTDRTWAGISDNSEFESYCEAVTNARQGV